MFSCIFTSYDPNFKEALVSTVTARHKHPWLKRCTRLLQVVNWRQEADADVIHHLADRVLPALKHWCD